MSDAIAPPGEQITDGPVFVAERDGVIVGFATVLPRGDGNAELDALFVDPNLWKRGVGRLLVEHCVGVARGPAPAFDSQNRTASACRQTGSPVASL